MSIVLNNEEFLQRVFSVAKTLQDVRNQISENAILSAEKTSILTKKIAVASVNFRNPVDQLISNLILDHCQKAEAKGPGSFLLCFDFILQRIISDWNSQFPTFDEICENSFKPTWENVKEILLSFLDEQQSKLLGSALELSGPNGKIFLEKATSPLTSIEVLNGFNFKCKNLIFANGSFSKAKLLVVDGLIESVAEINSLLQAFSETKETLLFVARGFDPDVINTLKVNFLRKTLNVIPFTVAYDFEGLNVLNDIAIVGCTDVVSSMKGQLISQIKYEEIICVDSVVIKGDSFTIVNDKAISRVKSHVSFLFEKRGTVALDQFEKIYDDRIKSLTPSSVRIRIANDHDTQAIIEKFDVALRLLRSSMLRGCIRTSFMKKKYGLFETLPDVYVLEAVLAAVAFATSCEKTIKNSLLISNA